MSGRSAGFRFVFALAIFASFARPESRRPEPALPSAPTDLATISLTLKLRTGGQLTGAVLDHDKQAIVLLSENTPYVFAWSELDAGSALTAKRTLLAGQRGGIERLSADDHFSLGMFAIEHGRNDLASNEFDLARKLRPQLAAKIKEAYAQFRRASESTRTIEPAELPVIAKFDKDDEANPQGADRGDDANFGPSPSAYTWEQLPAASHQVRAYVREVYLRFGEKVREVMGADIRLVESDHFLIWTDWGPREQTKLTHWCESMYAALCARFGLDANEDIFLAKCPVFCFRSKARFRKFARDFDGYDAKNAIGYTRSIEQNGHVHMAFARMGSTPADYDRFACTLVHEGTHAFLHRVYGFSLLPHWVNEGYAELTAERVLGDRCPAGENATLLARQYARFDWPVGSILNRTSTIEIHEYPLAHSVVAYLEAKNPSRFANLIRDLKNGMDLKQALASNFDDLTFAGLEQNWKESIRAVSTESDKKAG
jgi:hypothetical protein